MDTPYWKKHYEKNKKEILRKQRQYYWKTRDHKLEYAKQYRNQNHEYILNRDKKYRIKNKEQNKVYQIKYRAQNRIHLLNEKREWYWKNKDRLQIIKRKYYQDNKEHTKTKSKINYEKKKDDLRYKVLRYYSNGYPICACCGYHQIDFLTIDHINGRNNLPHRKRLAGIGLLMWIQKNNYPKEFQVLCYNCNCTKGYFGECSHKLSWHPINKQRRLKLRTLEAYGGQNPKCSCCHESNLGFLTIDHIKPKKHHNHAYNFVSHRFHYWLQRNNWPEGFQVLCYNCNSAKGTKEDCPHKTLNTAKPVEN